MRLVLTDLLAKPRKRLRIGDVLSIRSSHGVALLHYVGRDSFHGHAIYVYPAWHETLQQAMEAPLPEGYFTFYPAQSAVLQGLADIVGTGVLPRGVQLPIRHRRAGAPGRNGATLAWFIVEIDGRETMKRKLSAKDRKLPIASIWNHEFLVDRISDGWRPENRD